MSLATTHQNYSYDWWTPEPWMGWVRETLGCEPFDPCPRDHLLGESKSGLDIHWGSNWYCNHPGSRGSTKVWWEAAMSEIERGNDRGIWCAFSVEQLRHMYPSAFEVRGYLVLPRDRVGFVWGGPDMFRDGKLSRKHGVPAKSPGNWTVFWSTVEPAQPPTESVILKTGCQT